MFTPVKEYKYKNLVWIATENEYDLDSLGYISEEEALLNSEAIVQIKEGCSYEYELINKNSKFILVPGIIIPSKRYPYRGRIVPGNYVGHLPLEIIGGEEPFSFELEVRSLKMDYRSDYRTMLEDIAKESASLVLLYSSPIFQTLSVDYDLNSQSIYQKFAFVQSMIDSDEFLNSMNRIIYLPIKKFKNEIQTQNIGSVKKITSFHIKQFKNSSSRILIPNTNQLSRTIATLPVKINSVINSDTVDTSENRFIKYALSEFFRFVSSFCSRIEISHKDSKPHIYIEAKRLEEKLSQWLNSDFFKDISSLNKFPLNNIVLQRKEGYRHVFHVWLMYDLAAKLTWDGLDPDTYFAGKRDIAKIYEYWIFFKLLRIIEKIFDLSSVDLANLFKPTKDGLGLKLKEGTHTVIKGTYKYKKRDINVKYHYNKTFSFSKYPDSGSWTQEMRPDYTLSFWPMDFSEQEAEKQELIMHIHFDAKYKLESINKLFKNSSLCKPLFMNVQQNEKQTKYKNSDLLKMHAYRDAIRRSAGAYIIYPGNSEPKMYKGYHEILPGLGAFSLSPSNSDEGIDALKQFITEILEHYSNRLSQRELNSYYLFKNVNTQINRNYYYNFPEYVIEKGNKIRLKPINEIKVLIYTLNNEQKKDLFENRKLFIPIKENLSMSVVDVDYLLLLEKGLNHNLRIISNKLYKIMSYPKIISKTYSSEHSIQNYLVYKINFENNDFETLVFNINYLASLDISTLPVVKMLQELL